MKVTAKESSSIFNFVFKQSTRLLTKNARTAHAPDPKRRPAGTATPSAPPWARALDDNWKGGPIRKRAAVEAKEQRRTPPRRLKQAFSNNGRDVGSARGFNGTTAETRHGWSTPRIQETGVRHNTTPAQTICIQ